MTDYTPLFNWICHYYAKWLTCRACQRRWIRWKRQYHILFRFTDYGMILYFEGRSLFIFLRPSMLNPSWERGKWISAGGFEDEGFLFSPDGLPYYLPLNKNLQLLKMRLERVREDFITARNDLYSKDEAKVEKVKKQVQELLLL